MVETNINFQCDKEGILAQYNCKTKEVKLFLSEYTKYVIKDEEFLRDCICFSLNHEYLHALIDKVLHRSNYKDYNIMISEEKAIGAMIGFYRSKHLLGKLFYEDYLNYWTEYNTVLRSDKNIYSNKVITE